MIPDAVRAVITAAIEEHPTASPELLARLVVAELRDLGWHITAKPIARRAFGSTASRATPIPPQRDPAETRP